MFELPQKRPLIMGIINVTPDSFSGDGLAHATDRVAAAVQQAEVMVRDGADILDIGGESTRPNHTPVTVDEELRRVVPVVAALAKKFPHVPLAVDTVKAQVAQESLAAGAHIINDISALAGDADMARVVAAHHAMLVLMHNSAHLDAVTHDATVGGEYQANGAEAGVDAVIHDVIARVAVAQDAGIALDRIILDPGLGFGKTVAQNLALIHAVGKLRGVGFPVLIGSSRKSFIGRVLNLPVDERVEGTAATIAIAVYNGADIVRVHDVRMMARVAKMAAAFALMK